MQKQLLLIIVLVAFTGKLWSQENEMNPDRPDQTEEVHLVPKGRFMLETGVSANKFDSGRNANIVKAMLPRTTNNLSTMLIWAWGIN